MFVFPDWPQILKYMQKKGISQEGDLPMREMRVLMECLGHASS